MMGPMLPELSTRKMMSAVLLPATDVLPTIVLLTIFPNGITAFETLPELGSPLKKIPVFPKLWMTLFSMTTL